MGVEQVARERKLLKAVERANVPFQLIVPSQQRWTPGALVRVAFKGGSPELHTQIEAAALEWIGPDRANLQLSFRNPDGSFRTWETTDTGYNGEIRVGFDLKGRWSLVGRASIDAGAEGGRPGEASMNLADFDNALPADWRATVIHEFGHALGFKHEHQNPAAACGFRFYNDSDYRATLDSDGWYTADDQGRRPGLYTYLGGKANYWSHAEVDANLKSIVVSSAFINTGFDNRSIMKYSFEPSYFEAGAQSPCYSSESIDTLSAADIAGAHAAYRSDISAEERLGLIIIQQFLLKAGEDPAARNAVRMQVDRIEALRARE